MNLLAHLIAKMEEMGPLASFYSDDNQPLRLALEQALAGQWVARSAATDALTTGSLDAAVAFQAAMLPGCWRRQEYQPANGLTFVMIAVKLPTGGEFICRAEHTVPAIALVLATLKALQSKEGQPA